MDFLSIRITEQSVIAVAENKRRVCPARQPSPKKSPSFRMPIVASFPLCETTLSRTLSFLYVKNGIGQVTLNKDRLLLTKRCDFSPAIDGRKKCLGIEFAEFLSRHHGCCEPPTLSVCAESNFL